VRKSESGSPSPSSDRRISRGRLSGLIPFRHRAETALLGVLSHYPDAEHDVAWLLDQLAENEKAGILPSPGPLVLSVGERVLLAC